MCYENIRDINKNKQELSDMKKMLIILFVVWLAVFLTWDNEEKQRIKENNVEQIEKNIKPYLE